MPVDGCPTSTLTLAHTSRVMLSMSATMADLLSDIAPESTEKLAETSTVVENPDHDTPGVRFSAAVEEIAPAVSAATMVNESSHEPAQRDEIQTSPFTEVAADQLHAFTKSLHGRSLQELRMNTCQFEAFSLPPSRVCALTPSARDRFDHPSPRSVIQLKARGVGF